MGLFFFVKPSDNLMDLTLLVFTLTNLLVQAEGVCQCNNYLSKSLYMGQCRERTKLDPRNCGLYEACDSKLSAQGFPYNWSCQACTESTWPYPAPLNMKRMNTAPDSKFYFRFYRCFLDITNKARDTMKSVKLGQIFFTTCRPYSSQQFSVSPWS